MELKLHHVNYATKDVGALAEFYRSLFNLKPVPGNEDARITSQGYDRKVEFLTDGTTEFHIAPQDLGVAFRTRQSLNPLDRGHIAFRTDDIEAFKAMLREKNIQFADYGVWAIVAGIRFSCRIQTARSWKCTRLIIRRPRDNRTFR